MKSHLYKTFLTWTGNTGKGTSSYREYKRSHTISIENKPDIHASSDPSFRGDRTRHNPEELFVASLSSCHMLWYLHLCSEAEIVITSYQDSAIGTMKENADGSGQFAEVILHPVAVIGDASKTELAKKLHHKAHKMCFIARSCNFPVKHEPVVEVEVKEAI